MYVLYTEHKYALTVNSNRGLYNAKDFNGISLNWHSGNPVRVSAQTLTFTVSYATQQHCLSESLTILYNTMQLLVSLALCVATWWESDVLHAFGHPPHGSFDLELVFASVCVYLYIWKYMLQRFICVYMEIYLIYVFYNILQNICWLKSINKLYPRIMILSLVISIYYCYRFIHESSTDYHYL